jgi:hypothetical protein
MFVVMLFARVAMIVCRVGFPMVMGMFMFMVMLVCMGMGMLMDVLSYARMLMLVFMFVGMLVFVLVVAFHGNPLFRENLSVLEILYRRYNINVCHTRYCRVLS